MTTSVQHHALAAGAWQEYSLVEQLANVGSEIHRTISHRQNTAFGDPQDSFFRALELLDLTYSDPKNRSRLTEVCRVREALVDWWYGSHLYHTTDEQWEKYFYQFAYLARNVKIKP